MQFGSITIPFIRIDPCLFVCKGPVQTRPARPFVDARLATLFLGPAFNYSTYFRPLHVFVFRSSSCFLSSPSLFKNSVGCSPFYLFRPRLFLHACKLPTDCFDCRITCFSLLPSVILKCETRFTFARNVHMVLIVAVILRGVSRYQGDDHMSYI